MLIYRLAYLKKTWFPSRDSALNVILLHVIDDNVGAYSLASWKSVLTLVPLFLIIALSPSLGMRALNGDIVTHSSLHRGSQLSHPGVSGQNSHLDFWEILDFRGLGYGVNKFCVLEENKPVGLREDHCSLNKDCPKVHCCRFYSSSCYDLKVTAFQAGRGGARL